MTGTGEAPLIPERQEEEHSNRLVYVTVGVVVAIVLVVSLIAFSRAEDNTTARGKAEQLQRSLRRAGLPAPADITVLVRAFGDDGGAVCQSTGSDLAKATLDQQLSNGAAGPGLRPVTVDATILRGELIVLRTYCPEKADDFLKDVVEYKLDDVINGGGRDNTGLK